MNEPLFRVWIAEPLWIDLKSLKLTACSKHRHLLTVPALVNRPNDIRRLLGCEAGHHQ